MRGFYIKEGKDYTPWGEKNMDEREQWSVKSGDEKLREAIEEKVIELNGEVPGSKSLDLEQVKKYTEMAYKLIMFILNLWVKNG